MWNKLYIIIDKKSVKPLLFWKFSGKDIIIMVIGFCFGYFPVKTFFGDLIGLTTGLALFAILGFLLIEMPNNLSILQHVQKWYEYHYKKPKEYFYIPKSKIIKKEVVTDQETLEWMEYQDMVQKNKLS